MPDRFRCFWCGSDEIVKAHVVNRPDLISVSMDCAAGHRSTTSWAPDGDRCWTARESWRNLTDVTPSPQQAEVAFPTPEPTDRRSFK